MSTVGVDRQNVEAVVRVGCTYEEAAASLGISLSSFKRHVLPEIKVVRRGALRIVPVAELERFCERQAVGL